MQLREKITPSRTALLIVDMQNDFCSPGGFIDRQTALSIDMTRRAAERISSLRDAANALDVLTVHVLSHFDEHYLNPAMRERLERLGVDPYCVSGTWGAQEIESLRAGPGEIEVVKHAYDGFYATELEKILKDRGIETVIMTGLATDNCVAATAKGAFYRGHYVVVASDACAAGSDAQHEMALLMARHAYAEACTTDDILSVWSTGVPDDPCVS
ncbi:cysteine hydrolase [Microtetraspora sp. NBRC 16547]|uniref:cysteine hydrolase family protein n=1 Tax=Microtetraspora sp. NBRC 16547 TaxID=3030993 RepID=UPI0024A5F2EB|nr:cysteine hydrolase [Microtetraspora sp. NBRC 16547]GLW99355.1 isochorismatase [Microtetraspora sp. NBRC 16547]